MTTKLIFILYFLGVGCNALSLTRNRRQLDVEIDMTTQLPVHNEEKEGITTEKTYFTIEPELSTQPNLQIVSDYTQYMEQNNNTDPETKYATLENFVNNLMVKNESIEEVTGSSLISLNAAFSEEVLSRFIADEMKTDQDGKIYNHQKRHDLFAQKSNEKTIENHATEKNPSSTTEEPISVSNIFSKFTTFLNPSKPDETHKPAPNFSNENDFGYMEPLLVFDENFNPKVASDSKDRSVHAVEDGQLAAPTNVEVASPPPATNNVKSELMAAGDDDELDHDDFTTVSTIDV